MTFSLGISDFLKRSLVFLSLLFQSISLHCSFMKVFLSLFASLQNSTLPIYILFSCLYISLSPLPFMPLFSSGICNAFSDNHFVFLHFFFLGMVLVTASCSVLRNSVHNSSGSLSIRSNPLNLCHFYCITVRDLI